MHDPPYMVLILTYDPETDGPKNSMEILTLLWDTAKNLG